ncbi:MAG: TetR family transcriptional regulator [Desulfuromonadales bacterium]|nr:TetR family transcriptional regulator [Desulfuromonadales bacterium]
MESTYDRLVSAAIKLMIEKSYAGTSIGMLAEEVGISKSTVIHYFKSKEGILLAILENFFPVAIKELRTVVNNKSISGTEKLRRFLYFQMKLVAESGDVLTLVIRETRYLGEEHRKIYNQRHREYEGLVVKIIEQIQTEETSLFKNKDKNLVMKAIFGMCNYTTIWYRPEGPLRIDEIADQFFDILSCNV